MTFLIGILARWGVPPALRKVVLAGVALALVVALAGLWLTLHDRGVIRDHEAEREAAAADARETAAAERLDDAKSNAEQEDRRNDAIDKATDSAPSDADRRLNCERLRALGRVPPGC